MRVALLAASAGLLAAPASSSAGPLGDELTSLVGSIPCHPRFDLEAFQAVTPDPDRDAEVEEVVAPALPDAVGELFPSVAEAARVTATLRDRETGAELWVTLVRRSGSEAPRWEGVEPAPQPGPGVDEWVAWSRGADHLLVARSDGEPDGGLVEDLLSDRCAAWDADTLARPLAMLPSTWLPGDRPIAVAGSRLDRGYVDDKRDADWAGRLEGRWATTTWVQAHSGDLWSLSTFDLETDELAADLHRRLYGDPMAARWRSRDNARAQGMGLNAVYRTRVQGEPAWYVDTWWGPRHKELNFVAGPFVFAVGSYAFDSDPLLMGDLVARAELLPAIAPPYEAGQGVRVPALR